MTRTNAFTMLCVLIRAGAALLFAMSVTGLVSMFAANIGRWSETWSDWWIVWSYGLPFFASVLFWLFPDWLARIALARRTGEVFESDLDAEAWQAIVNGGIGLYFIVQALGWGAREILLALMHARNGSSTPLPEDFAVNLATTLVTLAVGFGLLLGARGIAQWVGRLRGRGAGPL